MSRLFGTDGVRGVANVPPLTPELALSIGRAVAQRLREVNTAKPRVLIGRDTRLSGSMLESAVAAGVCSAGGDVLRAGVLPTPGVAYCTREMAADAGVVISASHNPFQDNGIKLFSRDGFKLPDVEEDRIEELVFSAVTDPPTGPELGTVTELGDALERYVAFCCRTLPSSDLAGLHLVLDCANGATHLAAPAVFSALGARVSVLGDQPDGVNINEDCGSEHPEVLISRVRELGAQVGLAFDGDGDRLRVVDERGALLTGDQVMAICAQMYQERGWLDHDVVVTTVMSNFGLAVALRGLGIEHAASKVGDRYVLELMRERGAVLGGEDSGHIIFLRHHTTGDGIIAALQVLGAMRFYGRPLSTLAQVMRVTPQRIINVDVASKPSIGSLQTLSEAIAAAEEELGDDGRVLVRYSGTQAMCRVMVEGPSQEMTDRLAACLAGAIREEIGARSGAAGAVDAGTASPDDLN